MFSKQFSLSLSLFQIENVTIVRYLASDVSLARTHSENAEESFRGLLFSLTLLSTLIKNRHFETLKCCHVIFFFRGPHRTLDISRLIKLIREKLSAKESDNNRNNDLKE